MADELIPPQIRNGGAGPAPTAGRTEPGQVAQSPDAFNAVGVDRAADAMGDAAAARARALGGLFKEFQGISNDVGTKAATQAGALAGAASGATGHPQYKQGLARFTAYSQAFNNAATGAYTIEAEAQADDTAARLRVAANNDPATFRATYAAARDAVLKQAPAMAVPMLTELYNKRLAEGLAAISGDQATEQRNLQRKTYDEGVSRQTSKVAYLQGSENADDQAAAMDEHTKLSLMIDGGVTSGLYSKAEAQAMHVNAMRQITGQVFETQFDRTLHNDGAVAAVELLDRFQAAHMANLGNKDEAPILSEPEYQKLYADGVTKLREYNLGIAALKRDGKTAEQEKFEEGDRTYTGLFLRHQLTDRALDAAVRNGDLKPERATSLHSLLLQGNQVVKSDPRALLALHTDPHFLDKSDAEIAETPGVSPTDALKAIDERDRRNGSWEGQQYAKDARGAISAALKILPGTPAAALSDEQRRGLVDAEQEYIQLMNATKPSERQGASTSIAQTVVQHAQQRQAQAEVRDLMSLKDAAMKNHGPGSAEEWDKEKMEKYLKDKDAAISAAQARVK